MLCLFEELNRRLLFRRDSATQCLRIRKLNVFHQLIVISFVFPNCFVMPKSFYVTAVPPGRPRLAQMMKVCCAKAAGTRVSLCCDVEG